MSTNSSSILIVGWLAYVGLIVYLANLLGAVAIPLAAITMVPLIVMVNLVMKYERRTSASETGASSDQEKRKRKRIDNMIRDMSDEDLLELRKRLQDGSFDEEVFYDRVVGDDGELMRR